MFCHAKIITFALVNLRGSFLMMKHSLVEMKKHNYGRILLIASIAGKEVGKQKHIETVILLIFNFVNSILIILRNLTFIVICIVWCLMASFQILY